MKSFPITGMGATAVGLSLSRYPAGKSLAVLLLIRWPASDDGPENTEEHPLSVNLTDRKELALVSSQLPENHFYAKNWSENEHIYQDCLREGLFEETGVRARTGFVAAPLCKLTQKGLDWVKESQSLMAAR